MLAQQLEFQHRLGHDFAKMTTDERIAHVKDMFIAAICELTESLGEVSWKPWATGTRFSTLAFIGELNDTWQFLANMWFVAMPNATTAEIASEMQSALERKLVINYQRVIDGYDGVSTKCPECHRALDDSTVLCSPDLGYCAA
jgi:hypothetical protein